MAQVPERYTLHRLALAPLLPEAKKSDLKRCCEQATAIDEAEFVAFLRQQQLAPLWDECITWYGAAPLSRESTALLHKDRLNATGDYLLQQHNLGTVRRVLEDAHIEHVVFKGADTRERFYQEPSLRPAVDLDVLIPEADKAAAINAFTLDGFEFYGVPENISHECSLVKGKTCVDLHWDILRPGRCRVPMAPALLATRQDFGSHWGLDDTATLFMLLVHPVFTKYLTAPHASVVRQLDVAYLLASGQHDWQQLLHMLDGSGLKTAAWLSLQWLQLLTGIAAPNDVVKQLQPGPIRRGYLRYWMHHDLSNRWLEQPARIQLGLTLPAHDTSRDALRALKQARGARHTGQADLKALAKQLESR